MAASMKQRNIGRNSDRRGYRNNKDRLSHGDRDDDLRPVYNSVWTPSSYTAFKALLSARLCAAIWCHITDCDETFNYWEPLSYLTQGHGFQTWEYSPVYGIRSYAYIWLYILPIKLYTALTSGTNTMIQFYFLRTVLAFVSALCEAFFYKAVTKHFGANVGRLLLCFLVFASGMFISSTAFLPSSFSMYMTCVAIGAWYANMYPLAIFGTAASAIIGWPFAGALGIPIAWDIVVKQKKVITFIGWSLLSAVLCLVPLVTVDSHYYGKLVVAPLNIVLYNVFSEHGPDIYGVEPWTFYFLNGFLNFNFVFLLAIIAVPFIMVLNVFLKSTTRGVPVWLSLGPMYIWMIIFFTRPHKEERFLFPIYPLICLAGAVTFDHVQRLMSWLFSRSDSSQPYTSTTRWLAVSFCVGFATLSLSRSFALYKGYHAPLDVYGELNQILTPEDPIHTLPPGRPVNVCVGKEWYRYPTTLFLPSHNWRLQFIKSQFRGQLPKMYSTQPEATRLIPSHMNDMNLEETSRYLDVSKCHYMIDLDLPEENQYEPRYSQNTKDWKLLATSKFLDNQRSHSILRAFYIPFLSYKYCSYADYNLLQSKHYTEIKL